MFLDLGLDGLLDLAVSGLEDLQQSALDPPHVGVAHVILQNHFHLGQDFFVLVLDHKTRYWLVVLRFEPEAQQDVFEVFVDDLDVLLEIGEILGRGLGTLAQSI